MALRLDLAEWQVWSGPGKFLPLNCSVPLGLPGCHYTALA